MYDTSRTQTKQAPHSTYYSQSSDFLINPFDSYYQNRDAQISDRHEIQQIIYLIEDQENKIAGDYDLDELCELISDHTMAYVKSGLLAAKIRFLKLYKKQYSNFTDFCEQRLGRSRSYIDRLINSSRVVVELIMAGCDVLPRNESQCRLLSKFAGSELIWRWKAIIETIKPHKITAEAIASFLAEEEEEKSPPEDQYVKITGYLAIPIQYSAMKFGMTFQDFVVTLLEYIFKPAKSRANWRDYEREYEWELDLEKLVKEGEDFFNSR